jgi:hypothetical protein
MDNPRVAQPAETAIGAPVDSPAAGRSHRDEISIERGSAEIDRDVSDEEVDLWWGSFSGRTLAPDFVICGLLTVTTLGLAWYFRTWHGASVVRSVALVLTGLFWCAELAHVAYRCIAVNYRLTTRALYYDYGFFWPVRIEHSLSDIAQVVVERNLFERLLGVGRLRVLAKDAALPQVVFQGVRDPDRIAMEIRKQVEKVRAAIGLARS